MAMWKVTLVLDIPLPDYLAGREAWYHESVFFSAGVPKDTRASSKQM